jgi:proteasome lid subunit RPN8/RPN11
MKKNTELNGRPKVKILENAYNEIISTIGSRPAESGGLLFGKEDDMIVRKFVFDKHARTTRSTYTFNTEFLNPEIKRIWNEEGLSCIGFIHSHPHGYGRLSSPDVEYFSNMFESMPRVHYITPIVFTVPDGGFKLNAHILPNQSRETIKADIEVLPDDYFQNKVSPTEKQSPESPNNFFVKGFDKQKKFDAVVRMTWVVWQLILAFGLSWFLLRALYIFTNHLNKIWS